VGTSSLALDAFVSRYGKTNLVLIFWFACVLPLLAAGASAHDRGSYGGVFRSRNLGATWLNADVGLFLNAALALAPDPRDSSRLLVGTDLGILSSQNGGRSWVPEAHEAIIGAVFALAFSRDGERAVCAAASGVFHRSGERWQRADAPEAALPARALVAGSSSDHFYLLGRTRLFASRDGGRTYALVPGLAETSVIKQLVALPGSRDTLAASIDGRAMISHDGGHTWKDTGLGGTGAPVDTLAADAFLPRRIWAALAHRIVVSDDLGSAWHSAGRSLPDAGTSVRGVAASADSMTMVVTSDRGIYRSTDSGETWTLKEDNLPAHIEAGPLARDPSDPDVIYAVFSLMPYAEVWRMAIEGRNLLARIEPISLAGGLAFCTLLLIGGGLAVRRLARWRAAAHSRR
jgi:photosystem II stability/assembly factor-like uncharacterized protein